MKQASANPRMKNKVLVFLCLVFIQCLASASSSQAYQPDQTIVRTGWYNSTFNAIDRFGRRTGFAYEYQQKIAAYTDWKYEYVEGSWSNLLQMLIEGKIDILSDVSFTQERAAKMYYSSLPMGSESYYLFISANNTEITAQDFSTINGKRIGVNKDSIQKEFFMEWAEAHNVHPQLIELTSMGPESVRMLKEGELDGYVAIEGHGDVDECVPVVRVGSSDFYFAVSKKRPDLLSQLDYAMSKIMDENRYYNMQLSDKYLRITRTEAFLSPAETNWLSQHGPIKIGYRDNYLPFSVKDPKTGELTGALKDFLALASDGLKNASPDFEAIPFSTVEAAIQALNNQEIDCVFPVYLSAYDGEMMNIMMTVPFMDSEMHAVMRSEDHLDVSPDREMIVAINEGNLNYETFVKENFPNWKITFFPDSEDCILAVASGEADCLLISNYRILQMSNQFQKHRLSTITTGKGMTFSFALRRTDNHLYSILNKSANLVPERMVDLALINNSYNDKKVSLTDFLRDNWMGVIVGMAVVFVVIIILLLQRLNVEKEATERQKLIAATELDPLTQLYNRNFFFEYANRMYHEHPDKPMDAVVLNIEQFHTVNALNGRDFGDSVLNMLGREIRGFLSETEGLGGRFEADRFDIYCTPQANYQDLFSRFQVKLSEFSKKANIRLRMGIMPWEKNVEPVQLFDRARTACNMARGGYRKRLMVFDETMRRREILDQQLLNDLRRAVEEHEFIVYFQPKYDIQSDPPKLNSAEALIRWRHPELGMIAPDEFIPLFEKNGQIGIVDNYVWAETARQIAAWKGKFGLTVPVSVNLSRMDVFDPSLEPTLEDLLRDNNLDHSSFKLEVTESAYVEDSQQVLRVIRRLRDKGFEIEMDDFGSGYSSLNMISAMPIDVLKMDRAFIRNIEHSQKDLQLVELILDIAGSLKVPVIAEGVETERQMLLLKELGCAMVQGYYFSKPLPAEEFEMIILQEKENKTQSTRGQL